MHQPQRCGPMLCISLHCCFANISQSIMTKTTIIIRAWSFSCEPVDPRDHLWLFATEQEKKKKDRQKNWVNERRKKKTERARICGSINMRIHCVLCIYFICASTPRQICIRNSLSFPVKLKEKKTHSNRSVWRIAFWQKIYAKSRVHTRRPSRWRQKKRSHHWMEMSESNIKTYKYTIPDYLAQPSNMQ